MDADSTEMLTRIEWTAFNTWASVAGTVESAEATIAASPSPTVSQHHRLTTIHDRIELTSSTLCWHRYDCPINEGALYNELDCLCIQSSARQV